MRTTLLLPLMFLIAASASGQQPPPVAPIVPPDADVVVQHRTDAAMARLVEMMTSAPRGAQIARWNGAICPRVLDLDDTHAALIEGRIDAVATSLKIAVTPQPCKPNIVIIASPDADALTKTLVERHPGLFADAKYGIHHGQTLTDIEASRPVRWVEASRTGNADASRIFPADGTPGSFDTIHAYNGGSRISSQTRENAIASFAIVDTRQLSHITWGQLADYLALVTLAHPTAAVNQPDSVMSIFTARDAGTRGPPGLTATDQSMLQGLYRSGAGQTAQLQRSQILDQMQTKK